MKEKAATVATADATANATGDATLIVAYHFVWSEIERISRTQQNRDVFASFAQFAGGYARVSSMQHARYWRRYSHGQK